jgi:hypothetical protein
MPFTPEQREELEGIFTQMASNAFERIRGLSLSAHAVNPFLSVLVARTPAELAEFIVNQRVERGLVTSLGMQLQKIARIVGSVMHSSGVAGADLEGQHAGLQRHLLMQVKSGPDTVNLDIANQIKSKLNQAERRIRSGGLSAGWSVEKMLGMCYGQPRHRNGFVLGLGTEGIDVEKIGRAFWEFITDDPDMFRDLFALAATIALNYKNGSGKTLAEAISDAKAALTAEITSKYGDGLGEIDWDKLLNDNM